MGRLDDYIPVSERLAAAAPDLLSITTTEPVMLDGDMGYIRARVTLQDGRYADGTATFRLGLTGQSAQATSPIEDCETSAVGRALAMLGYEVKRGVASREEVAGAQRRAAGGAAKRAEAEYPRPQGAAQLCKTCGAEQDWSTKKGRWYCRPCWDKQKAAAA